MLNTISMQRLFHIRFLFQFNLFVGAYTFVFIDGKAFFLGEGM